MEQITCVICPGVLQEMKIPAPFNWVMPTPTNVTEFSPKDSRVLSATVETWER